MRPGALGQIFDGGGKPGVALDQKNVTGLQRVTDDVGGGGIKRRVTAGGPRQIFEDLGAEIRLDLVEHEPQSYLRAKLFGLSAGLARSMPSEGRHPREIVTFRRAEPIVLQRIIETAAP